MKACLLMLNAHMNCVRARWVTFCTEARLDVTNYAHATLACSFSVKP